MYFEDSKYATCGLAYTSSITYRVYKLHEEVRQCT